MQLGAYGFAFIQTWVRRLHRVQPCDVARRPVRGLFDKLFQLLLHVQQFRRHGPDARKGFGVLAGPFGVHMQDHGRRQVAVVAPQYGL